MPIFQYTAKDLQSKKVSGQLEATDRKEVAALLLEKGQYLITCSDVSTKDAASYKLKLKELSSFCRELGTMLSSGVSLIKAMSILVQREEKKKRKAIYLHVYRKLQQGITLSIAMQEEGKAFPELMIHMIRSGENSGHLDQTAMTLAVQYEKEYRMKSKMRNAMIYPIVLVFALIVGVLFLFIKIVPEFIALFKTDSLPLITKIVIAISDFLVDYWFWGLIGCLILIALITYLCSIPRIRYQIDKRKLRIFFIGKLLRTMYTARFARTMCSLYTSGISVINALAIIRNVIGNTYIEAQFDDVTTLIRNGETLSTGVKTIHGFDSKLASSIYVGEESGHLDAMLESLADSFDYDAQMASQRLVTLMEPMIIIFMGIIVLIVMLAVLLPIIGLYQNPTSMM